MAVATGTAPSGWDDLHDLVTAVEILNEADRRARRGRR